MFKVQFFKSKSQFKNDSIILIMNNLNEQQIFWKPSPYKEQKKTKPDLLKTG